MRRVFIRIKNTREIELVWIFLVILLLLTLIFSMFYFMYHSASTILFPFDIDYGEGITLFFATMFFQGENIYTDVSSYPLIPCLYTPVYPLLSAILIPVLGKSFISGRLISLMASLLIGVIIYKMVKIKTGNFSASLISSLVFFSFPHVVFWCSLFRVDTLAALFNLSGIYLFYKYRNTRGVYIVPFLFVLAIYTKQPSIILPVVTFTYLFIRGEKKLSLNLAAIFLAVSVVLSLIIDHITIGQFYLNIIRYNTLQFSITRAIDMDLHFALEYPFILSFVLAYLFRSRLTLLNVYLITSLIYSGLIVGRVGSNFNYFLEPMTLMCITLGLFLNKWGINLGNLKNEIKIKHSYSHVLIIALLMAQILLSVFSSSLYTMPSKGAGERISTYVANSKGNVLIEDVGFALINNKEALIDSALMYELERKGIWNSSQLVEDCEAKKFSLIIYYWRFNQFQELIKCIDENYEKVDEINYGGSNHLVYKPKSL